jgi:hypothetical protein
MKINPYEIVEMRRSIKKFEEVGVQETMKIVKKLREMKLDNEMLVLTECPRTLLYVTNRLKNVEADDPKHTLLRMCKYLYKEWKQQFHKPTKNEEKQ